mmetsp:Transcript_142234/g.318248  ORF Transcript_142234/g.318248 Transcript_142234/m.318248 type:complete len:339 (-) Transcript_142234:298-1314(-)
MCCRSRQKSASICGVMRNNNPGCKGRNSAPPPPDIRSMSSLASLITPFSPVSRIAVPWSSLATLAVMPEESWSCLMLVLLRISATFCPGTLTRMVSTVVTSANISSMWSRAAMAVSLLSSLAQIRMDRLSTSRVMLHFCSMFSFSLLSMPMEVPSMFLTIMAPSISASTSAGSYPINTPSIASLHRSTCARGPLTLTFIISHSSPSARSIFFGTLIRHPVRLWRSRIVTPWRPIILPVSRSYTSISSVMSPPPFPPPLPPLYPPDLPPDLPQDWLVAGLGAGAGTGSEEAWDLGRAFGLPLTIHSEAPCSGGHPWQWITHVDLSSFTVKVAPVMSSAK